MWEQWGTVVGALIGFGGLFVGLLVGRRQVTDQARVEHDQWLRGQRQAAYAQLLDAWDTAIRRVNEVVDGSEGHLEAETQGHDWDTEIVPVIRESIAEPWRAVWRATERVELLGPPEAVRAVFQMYSAGTEVASALLDFSQSWPNVERVHAAQFSADMARRDTVPVVAKVLQEAPSPRLRGRRWRQPASIR
ncbi:hypothetical protein ABT358_02390 [Streptomyces sp. NPDC000341]|uniref:hypothetical protein n=1 Tax=Streptomyces sp. NPDC000341 TaxID=3156645 RepID=UPI00331B9E91